MIDLNKPIRRKYLKDAVDARKAVNGYAVADANNLYIYTDEQFEACFENVPEPALDLNKPIRFSLTGEPRTVVVQPDGELHCFDTRGRICQTFASAVEALRLYENYVPKIEPYAFTFKNGTFGVCSGKGNCAGPAVEFSVTMDNPSANPKVNFTKTLSKGDVRQIADRLNKWLASVEPSA
jgi:hypothetical protein